MCSYSFKDFRIPLVFLNIGYKITPLFYKNQRIFINILIIHIRLEVISVFLKTDCRYPYFLMNTDLKIKGIFSFRNFR